MPTIDVVIPVKNGMPEIRECIEALKAQSVTISRIIAIDSGSTDGTDAFLTSQPGVELVRIDPSQFNHGLTRNLGWRRSDAELVFFTVQDARALRPDLLERLAGGFTDPDILGVCGRQVVCHDVRHNPLEWYRPISPPEDVRHQAGDFGTFEAYSPERKRDMCAWDNVVAMYRRTALASFPFREVSYGEDMLWAMDALRAGGAILYRPVAQVCHYHLENREVTIRRTLSIQFFRHLHFGYLYPRPSFGMMDIARMARRTVFEATLPWGRRLGWLRYNFMRRRAILEAWNLFHDALASGDAALSVLYRDWVEKPPVPLKKN